MTYKDFKRRVRLIESEPFKGQSFHPLDLGIERTHFEENKLKRLITLAKSTSFETAQRRAVTWERKLQRLLEVRARFEQARMATLAASRKAPSALDPTNSAPPEIAAK